MATIKVTTVTTYKRIKVDPSIGNMSEDDVMKQIVATHARSDGHVDVKSLFGATNNILTRATSIVDGIATGSHSHMESMEDKTLQAGFNAPSLVLEDISREMGCKALHGEHAHKASLSLLNMLSGYSWDAKAVLTLAAFAVTYGEFWLLAQHPADQLAKSVGLLKKVPAVMKPSGSQRLGIILLNNLVKSVLEITRCIVQIEKLSTKYTIKDVPALQQALSRKPIYVYWIVTTAICCASHLHSLTHVDEENPAQELSSLTHILTNIFANLQKQLDEINQQKDEYDHLHFLLKIHSHPTDNVEFLRHLIYIKEETHPLILGSSGQRIKIEDLRRKHVLLHISSVFISQEEIMTMKRTYHDTKRAKGSQCEIVWIPLVDEWNEVAQQKFQTIMAEIPYFTIQRPSSLYETPAGRAAVKFIKQEWHYQQGTIAVSMDSEGKVQNHNAFDMIRIWGAAAFPFTYDVEGEFWKKQTWSTELLLGDIHPTVKNWIKEGKYIFLYGGKDLKWIQDFEEKGKIVGAEARLPMEMLNLSRIGGKVKIDTIVDSFWTRFGSLWHSKVRREAHNLQDKILREFQKIDNHNRAGCWAVVCKGPKVLANEHGSILLSALWQFDAWKKNASSKGFDVAFTEYVEWLLKEDKAHKCSHFYFPTKAGKIPDHMTCPDCPRTMEKFIAFQCCHNDDNVTTIC